MTSRIEDPNTDPNLRVALQRKFLGYGLEARTMAQSAVSRLKGHRPPQKLFLIFGRGRSGSTLLTKLLDGHADITCLGEILRYRSFAPGRQLKQTLELSDRQVSGCKLLSYQMRTIHRMGPDSDFLRNLAASGVEILYLKRENLVRHAVSNLYARKRGAYHSSDKGAAVQTKVTIAPEEIFAWMEGSAALDHYEQQVLRDVPHMALTYERNLSAEADQMATYKSVLEQFGLSYTPPKATLRKVTPSEFSMIIENHDELMQALKDSAFAQFLDE